MENYLWGKGVAMKTLLENWNRFLAENRQNYHILSETAFSRIVTDYAEAGYIVITATELARQKRDPLVRRKKKLHKLL